MWELQACTVCFSTGVKLYNLDVGTLRNDFNFLSGLQMVQGNGLPQYLCVQCTAHIIKFMKFRQKCQRAYYALKQILCNNKEIKIWHLKNFDRNQLNIAPALSYMKEERVKNFKMQFKLVNFMRRGVPEPPGSIPVSHCIIPGQEHVVDLDMKVTRDDEEPNIKTEQENYMEFNEIEQEQINLPADVKQMDEIENDIFTSTHNGDHTVNRESIIKQAFDMVNNDDDIFNNDENIMDKSDTENNGFESTSCVLTNKRDGAQTIEAYGDVVPISFNEAKAAYEVYKYCSQGKFKCYCGMSCESKKVFEFHARQHNMKIIKKKKKKIPPPADFPLYSPQSHQEQYEIVEARKETRNYKEAKFRCELCYRGYRMTATYNRHMVKHNERISGSLQCDMCKQYFHNTRLMYKHMVMYHTRKFSCRHCAFVTTNKGQAWMHYKWHQNVTYDCPYCDKKFNKISTQLTHIRFKHPGTDVCSMCGHSFVSTSGLNCHRTHSHTKEERDMMEAMAINPDTSSDFYCADCRMQFASGDAYTTHLGSSKTHVDTNISSRSMMSHIRRMSRVESGIPYQPRRRGNLSGALPLGPNKGGGRGRKSAATLEGSSVLNTGATTATNCEVCGLYLASDVVARRHYDAEHPGADYLKRYMCDICGHTTRQYANLLVHMRTHTREKPYECPFCDRRFSMTSNRDRHLVVHTGEKRYQCQHCSRRFTQSTAVKLHIQTVHMKIPYEPWDKKNRRRRKDAQLQNAANAAEATVPPPPMTTAVLPVPQHKLVIGDLQGEYISYIGYPQEQ